RSLGGIYSMLRELEHHYAYRDIFLAYTEHALEVAAGRRPDGSHISV
ncbi:MAG: hypothetical protein ACI8S6_002199, partial [Myxococcota bacterium]